MPYQITTKDGITIRNIPDDVAPDSQVLKDRVATIRSGAPATDTATPAAPVSGAAAIPGLTPEQQALNTANQQAAGYVTPKSTANASLVDKLVGAGETGLTLLTGATGGTLGAVGGLIGGLAGDLMNQGETGDQARQRIGEAVQQGAAGLTYAPRTAVGQEMVGDVADIASQLPPVLPIAPEIAMSARVAPIAQQAAGTAAATARAATRVAAPAIERIKSSAPAIAERVQRTLNRIPEQKTTRGSAGAAATPEELQRRATAEDLPVPIDLTKGQATRDQQQLMFERETAKQPEGARFRQRQDEQNQQILQNIDAWFDQTGAEAPNLRAIGKTVDDALVKKSRRDKAEINTAYRTAERAGELEDPVSLPGLVEHLNESAPDAATAPLLNVARQRALQLGLATEGEGGILVPAEAPLRNIERYRQAVSRATDYEATNIRQSAIIKGLVDAGTEGQGGDLYRQARRMRENYAKQYEDRAVINNLMNTKRGSGDRKVAFEDVLDNTMIKGSLDDVRHVRRVLQTGGEEGQQAWSKLQGGTLNWMKEQATKGVTTDQAGNPVVSAAGLNRAIRTLDNDGRLDFIFGKKGAQQIRDINEITKLVQTVPPGSINTSGTTATLLAALTEAGAAGALTGVPVPVLSLGRALAARRKNIQLQKRIDEALKNPRRKAASKP